MTRLKVADIDSARNVLRFVPAKGEKIGKGYCRRSCANCCVATGEAGGPRTGYFPAPIRASPSR